jgi:hypothetical protein
MKRKQEWNDGYYSEIMDRINIIENNLEDFILKHPACDKYPELKGKLEAAAMILADAYQDFGQFL